MWRDILLIVSFVLAGLMYFGLTPTRLSSYAKTAKGEITKRNRFQKAALFLMLALTLVYIPIVIWRLETIELSGILLSIAIFFIGWHTTLSGIWELSERGEKILDAVKYSVFYPSLVASIILSDMLLWQKLVYPLGGFSMAIIVSVLSKYIRKKHEIKRPSQGDKKDSPL